MTDDRAITALLGKARRALEGAGLPTRARVVVAVSGGPDSVALLLALRRLAPALGLDLHVGHLDHGLRPGASQADARFVEELCRSLGVPCTVGRADVEALRSREGLSPEEAARRARFDFLLDLAHRQGAEALALGHTRDDQAETVLLHLLRGAGLVGLRGMEPVARRRHRGRQVLVLRPLLEASRGETEAFCRALGVEPRRDETNLSARFLRNRIRHELIPFLERYNPAVVEALARTARSLARDAAFLEARVEEAWPRVARAEEGAVALDRRAFGELHPALRAHLLRRAVAAAKGDAEDLEAAHVEAMLRLMQGPAGPSLDLPGGLRLTVGYGDALIAPADYDDCPWPPLAGEHPLQVPGETALPGWRVTASLEDGGDHEPGPSAERGLEAALDAEAVGRGLRVRTRRPGDRFAPAGLGGSKKLQDFFVDAQVPRRWRDRVPLVVTARGIAWVVGYRLARWAVPRGGRRLRLRFEPLERTRSKA